MRGAIERKPDAGRRRWDGWVAAGLLVLGTGWLSTVGAAPAKTPAPAGVAAPKSVSGELLDWRITQVEDASAGGNASAEASWIDLLVTDGGVRRERLPVDAGVRFRSYTVQEGRLVAESGTEAPDLQAIGVAFRSPAVRVSLNARGYVQQVELFPWVWKGRLEALAPDAVTLRGFPEIAGRDLLADWAEWDPETYADVNSKVIRIPLSPAAACTVNLNSVSKERLKLEKGRVIYVMPDAQRRARYLDVFKINATTSFGGGDYEALNLTEASGGGIRLKKDAQGRWGFAVAIETGKTDAQRKPLWSRPDVRVYDRTGLRVSFDGRVPENGQAGLWYDPRTAQITHVFW